MLATGNEQRGSRYAARRVAVLVAALLLVAGISMANSKSDGSQPAGLVFSKVTGMGALGGGLPASQAGATVPGRPVALSRPVVIHASHSDVSAPLRDMRPAAAGVGPAREDRNEESFRKVRRAVPKYLRVDTVVQSSFGPLMMPPPLITFEGYSQQDNYNTNNGLGVLPPDTNGDVGPNHYVQWVNIGLKIFDKSGNVLLGPVLGNTLWSGFPGTCAVDNNGDTVTLYDSLADRWLLSQFSIPSRESGPTYECIAISTTGDPTGSYYRYEFMTHPANFEDYPHLGVWPDAYYMTTNEFSSPVTFAGAGNFAFDRAKMLAGDSSATMQYFHLDSPHGGMLPADLDGTTPPPAGSPGYFAEFFDDSPRDEVDIYRFHVDWANSANSTFTQAASLATAPFDSVLCDADRGACIPQPGTTVALEDLADRLMFKIAYRNFGDHEALVLNHTVDADGAGQAGVRWYEVRNAGGSLSIYQQGTYAPDSDSRWMGSIGMDHDGNIAVGYSVSSSSVFPSIRYAGRLASDPPGVLSQGENTLIGGGGIQTRSDAPRWGDYSSIGIDPTDDCTFWYTNEYYERTSSANWQTRIGSVRFPQCGQGPPTPTVTGTPPTPLPTNTPTRTRTATSTPTNTPTPVCSVNYQSADVPKTIVEVLTITSSLTVNNGPVIASVQVTGVTIDHTYPSDLTVALITPSGTRVQLFGGICDGDPDWTQANTGFSLADGASLAMGSTCPPGTGTYRPVSPLSALAGQSSSGTWVLEIKDTAVPDEGTLYGWGLRINSNSACSTPTATSTPMSVLVGHVTWQGRPAQPSALQQLPITLTLRSAATEINYPVMTTDARGFFTANVSGLLPGVYTWRAKSAQVGASPPQQNPGWLATSGTVLLAGAASTQQEMGLQRAGDCNNDNVDNATDFVMLKNTFGQSVGQSQYDNRADFTGDTVVNSVDFSLLKANFGQSGAPPASP
ncbi:MAG: proprotein convertase P-domain-containing protein [Chloroflexia bacterium]